MVQCTLQSIYILTSCIEGLPFLYKVLWHVACGKKSKFSNTIIDWWIMAVLFIYLQYLKLYCKNCFVYSAFYWLQIKRNMALVEYSSHCFAILSCKSSGFWTHDRLVFNLWQEVVPQESVRDLYVFLVLLITYFAYSKNWRSIPR